MGIFNRKTGKPLEIATLGDMGVLLERQRGNTNALSRLRSDNFEENGVRNKIDNGVKEAIYFFEPLTYAGINNTSSKLFGNWFTMDMPDEGESMDESKRRDLVHFHNSIQLKTKMMSVANDSMTYGNGYMELIGERGNQNPEQPLTPQEGLKSVEIVEPIYIEDKTEKIDDDSFYYIHNDYRGNRFRIHNSRIIQIPWAKLGTMRFGKGVIEIGIRTMLAKIGMDWAIGEIIYRFGKPFLVLKTTGATKNEYKKSVEILQRLNPRTGFAGTERHDFSILNPSVIDPDNFAKYYYINQARALEMPMMIFIGSQKGAVTGSEVDLQDWYQTLHSKQESRFTDPIVRINNQYLKGNWVEQIYWNDIFVNQLVEWDINLKKLQSLDLLYRQNGILVDVEARQWCRDQGVPFPEDDKLFEQQEEDEALDFDITQIPDPFSPEAEEMQRKNRLIERLKNEEFILDQETFWRERDEALKKKIR